MKLRVKIRLEEINAQYLLSVQRKLNSEFLKKYNKVATRHCFKVEFDKTTDQYFYVMHTE